MNNSPSFMGTTTDQLSTLRLAYWLLKLGLIFFATELFGLTTPPIELNYVLVIEALYVAISFRVRYMLGRKQLLFITLLLDTIFWIIWLYCTGSAANAFTSLLLLPIAIAAIMLPQWAPWCLAIISTTAYSAMIFSQPDHSLHHGMDMSSHYLGMWFNFVISALVLTTTVAFIAKRIRQKDAELNYLREAQLRQEKLLALGTVSAQMAHQLATPLATLRLLLEELVEDNQSSPLTIEMHKALSRCEASLTDLRQATESIRSEKMHAQTVAALVKTLKDQVNLLMPEVKLSITVSDNASHATIHSDMSLLPALLALIENAARASEEVIQTPKVEINITLKTMAVLSIAIYDFGQGMSESLLAKLGHKLIENPKGLGIAVLLSHASFERLGGELTLQPNQDKGMIATVTLPIEKA
ncbi:sensor histidine kinase [Shewanella aestuarii]|uniref:histidine kinase n=1 Tax=Shewanella aestuarii TaxID=1028752 RepID=A0A6G9QP72_9GAMM|nr:ATP-binding protein [Shewanella aestuarii]QIR15893.1 HAMP domain-containing histidine kinase [Shewanella aestuarii]